MVCSLIDKNYVLKWPGKTLVRRPPPDPTDRVFRPGRLDRGPCCGIKLPVLARPNSMPRRPG